MIKKANHPAVSWVLIVSALGLGGNALYSANDVENLALANEKDIFYERELRIVNADALKENFKALEEDVDEVKQELKKETGDIKDLLNQLILRQVASPSN